MRQGFSCSRHAWTMAFTSVASSGDDNQVFPDRIGRPVFPSIRHHFGKRQLGTGFEGPPPLNDFAWTPPNGPIPAHLPNRDGRYVKLGAKIAITRSGGMASS